VLPAMGVFNNLVLFDQHVPQNSAATIRPELATSWSWSEDGTELIFNLRQGIKWHDGKPFTARDVQCTWELLQGKASDKLRLNPRRSWYRNLDDVTVHGDYEVGFRLKRPQPAFLILLASGLSPVYPCHVPARDMRQHPIGTGPFKFVEFKPNETIKVTRNPDYWKADRPYLDGIEYTVVPNVATRSLGFIAGKFDMTFPYTMSIAVMKDIKRQAPNATCELVPHNISRNVLINRSVPPFDNKLLRRAMTLSLDRQAYIDILGEGIGDIGGAMLPPPHGVWGMPAEIQQTLPGYSPDVANSRAEAKRIMQELGYGPDRRLAIKVSTRNLSGYRDAAVLLIDQLKHIYIDGELEPVETPNWYPKVKRKDFTVGLHLAISGVDDPDQNFFEFYGCGSDGNPDGYCNPELDQWFERQSVEPDPDKRRQLVWDIERKLAEDGARPILFHGHAATCWHPQVKGFTSIVNSVFNSARFEDLWLAR
jgi:peptide/nickel transport system substrate-binding protein